MIWLLALYTLSYVSAVGTEPATCAASTQESIGTLVGSTVTKIGHYIEVRDSDVVSYHNSALKIMFTDAGIVKHPLQTSDSMRMWDEFGGIAPIGTPPSAGHLFPVAPEFEVSMGEVIIKPKDMGLVSGYNADRRTSGHAGSWTQTQQLNGWANVIYSPYNGAVQHIRFNKANDPSSANYDTGDCNEPGELLLEDPCVGRVATYGLTKRHVSFYRTNRRCGIAYSSEYNVQSVLLDVDGRRAAVLSGDDIHTAMALKPAHQWKWSKRYWLVGPGSTASDTRQGWRDYRSQSSELTYKGHRNSLWRSRLDYRADSAFNVHHLYMGGRTYVDQINPLVGSTAPTTDAIQIIRHDGTHQSFKMSPATSTSFVNWDGVEAIPGHYVTIQYYEIDGVTPIGAASVTLEFKDWEGHDRVYRAPHLATSNRGGWFDHTMTFRDASCSGMAAASSDSTIPGGYVEGAGIHTDDGCASASSCTCYPYPMDVCTLPVGQFGERLGASHINPGDLVVSAPILGWDGRLQRVVRDANGDVYQTGLSVVTRGGVQIGNDDEFPAIHDASVAATYKPAVGNLNMTRIGSGSYRTFTVNDPWTATPTTQSLSGTTSTYQRMRATKCNKNFNNEDGLVAFSTNVRGGSDMLLTNVLKFKNPFTDTIVECSIHHATSAVTCDSDTMRMRLRLTSSYTETPFDSLVVPTPDQNGFTVAIAGNDTVVQTLYYEQPHGSIGTLELGFSYQCPFGYVQSAVGEPCDALCPGTDAPSGTTCSGHGTCSWVSNGVASCTCVFPWIGTACNFECPIGNSGGLDVNNTICSSHGTCVEDGAAPSTECVCEAEWDEQVVGTSTDEACNTNVKTKYCEGWALPELNVLGFVSCPCPLGRLGTHCEVNADLTYCMNHGSARFNSTSFTHCDCGTGWAGLDCGLKVLTSADTCNAAKGIDAPTETSFGVTRHNSNY